MNFSLSIKLLHVLETIYISMNEYDTL
jgi:hypothetical protein